ALSYDDAAIELDNAVKLRKSAIKAYEREGEELGDEIGKSYDNTSSYRKKCSELIINQALANYSGDKKLADKYTTVIEKLDEAIQLSKDATKAYKQGDAEQGNKLQEESQELAEKAEELAEKLNKPNSQLIKNDLASSSDED
ncbi:MAG TPA: DUF6507 family protein, partial [Chthoniobacterales bacterium]|nr:DUF6507 family protein [Chthoniobacterales bacterium]